MGMDKAKIALFSDTLRNKLLEETAARNNFKGLTDDA